MRFERWFMMMRRPEAIVTFMAMMWFFYVYIDKNLAIYCHHMNFKLQWAILSWMTLLGSSKIWLPSLLGLSLCFRYFMKDSRWETRTWFLFCCIALPDAICWVIKMLLGRARPVLWFQERLFGFYGWQDDPTFWSCPSGHATTIMGCVFGLSILFPNYVRAWLLMGFLVSCSRVLLTYHYASDILLAGYLTLLEVGVLYAIMQRKGWLQLAWAPLSLSDKSTDSLG